MNTIRRTIGSIPEPPPETGADAADDRALAIAAQRRRRAAGCSSALMPAMFAGSLSDACRRARRPAGSRRSCRAAPATGSRSGGRSRPIWSSRSRTPSAHTASPAASEAGSKSRDVTRPPCSARWRLEPGIRRGVAWPEPKPSSKRSSKRSSCSQSENSVRLLTTCSSPMPTSPSITSRLTPALSTRAAAPVDVEAAAVAVEHAGVAGADAHVGGDADVVGHDHAQAADADVELQRRAPGRQVDLA